LRSLGCKRRLTNKNRSGNKALNFLLAMFAFAGQTSRRFLLGRWATRFQLGFGRPPDAAARLPRSHHPFEQLLDDMKCANLMRTSPKTSMDGFGIKGRAIRK